MNRTNMKTGDVNRKINEINLDEKEKQDALDLINKKMDNDMKEVIAEIKSFKNEINTKLDTSIGALRESIESLRAPIKSSKGINTIIKWVI